MDAAGYNSTHGLQEHPFTPGDSMSWLITYQLYEYDRPQGKAITVVTETHPVELQRQHSDGCGNMSCAILFVMKVPHDIVAACS